MSENKKWNGLQRLSILFAYISLLTVIAILIQKAFNISDYGCGLFVGWFSYEMYDRLKK